MFYSKLVCVKSCLYSFPITPLPHPINVAPCNKTQNYTQQLQLMYKK